MVWTAPVDPQSRPVATRWPSAGMSDTDEVIRRAPRLTPVADGGLVTGEVVCAGARVGVCQAGSTVAAGAQSTSTGASSLWSCRPGGSSRKSTRWATTL